MVVDLKFFEHLIKVLETDTHILRDKQDKLKITEAWLYTSDVLMRQCKEMIAVEKFNEEREAVFHDMTSLIDDSGLTVFELIDLVTNRTLSNAEVSGSV